MKRNFTRSILTFLVSMILLSYAGFADTTAPVTTSTLGGTAVNDWFVSDVEVILSCSDTGEGCEQLKHGHGYGTEGDTTPTTANWQPPFHRRITVTNNGAIPLSNQHVLITMDTATPIANGKIASDCSNMRFKDSDASTLLSFWIQSGCNTANTRIWIKLPSIGANTNKDIFLYQGSTQGTGSSWSNAISPYVDSAALLPTWTGRSSAEATVHNGELYLIGGYDGSSLGDVYKTSNGQTWSLVTSSAPARAEHKSVSFANKLWIVGGYSGDDYQSGKNDVWSSSNNGQTWSQVVTNAPWAKRSSHELVVFNGVMYLIGGKRDVQLNAYLNDVWSSTDGTSWSLVTSNAAWSGRSNHKVIVYNNKMYLIGGYNGNTMDDVWSSTDGSTWTQETADAPWADRYGHQAVVFDDKMWVFGGNDGTNDLRDVWYSTNGQTWTSYATSAGWTTRRDHAATVFGEHVYLLGGVSVATDNQDVYRMFRTYPLMSSAVSTSETTQDPIRVSVGREGSINFWYRSTDAAANLEALKSHTFKIDKTAPTSSDNSTTGWVHRGDTRITCSDLKTGINSVSGCASTTYCIYDPNATACNPGTTRTNTGSIAVADSEFMDSGCQAQQLCFRKIRYFSTDVAGRQESVRETNVINIDKESPETADDAPATWQKTDTISVTLTCNDRRGAGCKNVRHCVGNGCTPGDDKPSPKKVDLTCLQGSECNQTFRFRSLDLFDNTETILTKFILFDTKAPFNTPTITNIDPTPSGYTVTSNHPQDNGVGIDVSNMPPYGFYGDNDFKGWQGSNIRSFAPFGPNSRHCFKLQFRDALDNQGAAGAESCSNTLANNPNVNVNSKTTGRLTVSIVENTNPLTTRYDMHVIRENDATQTVYWVDSGGFLTTSEANKFVGTKAQWNGVSGFTIRGTSTEELKPNEVYNVFTSGINDDGRRNTPETRTDIMTLARPPSGIGLSASTV